MTISRAGISASTISIGSISRAGISNEVIAPVWTPASISGLVAWYDPSDFSTMFQDSAGTTPVTAANDPVGKILDKSGNGYHAVQETAGSRPILELNSGYYSLKFDGTADFLSIPNFNVGTDEVSIFAAANKADSTARVICELSNNSNAPANAGVFVMVVGNNGEDGFSSLSRGTQPVGAVQNAAKAATAGKHVVSATHNISGDLSTIRVDGVAGTNGAGEKGAGDFLTYTMYIGARGGTLIRFNSHLYSLFLYSRVVTAGETTSGETYLAEKSGVTL